MHHLSTNRAAGFFALLAASAAAAVTAMAADTPRAAALILEGSSVTFDAATNISAVSVHGKSSAVTGSVRARQENGQLTIESLNATLPVDTIATGMALRDEHMRKYIFTAPDQSAPDLKLTAANVSCPVSGANCAFAGKMSIRGVERPVQFSLKIKPAAGSAYRATADGVIKLSDYGIERPSQFGVKCADEVKIHLEVTGKEMVEASSRLGSNR